MVDEEPKEADVAKNKENKTQPKKKIHKTVKTDSVKGREQSHIITNITS